MMGQGDLAADIYLTPDFMAAWTRAVEGISEGSEFLGNLIVFET